MSVQYHLVFYLASIEVIILFGVLAPLPLFIRRKIYTILDQTINSLLYILMILFSIVSLLFFDALNKVLYEKTDHQKIVSHNTIIDPFIYCKKFYAERNLYLTGITIILGFILYRIPRISNLTENKIPILAHHPILSIKPTKSI